MWPGRCNRVRAQ